MGLLKNITSRISGAVAKAGRVISSTDSNSFFHKPANIANPTTTDVINELRGTAYICVKAITQEVKRLEIKTISKTTGQEVESELINLLQNPNPGLQLTQPALFEFLQGHKEIAGEHFWIFGLKGETSKLVETIYPARPDRMDISVDEYGDITGYVYTNDLGHRIPLEVNEVAHFKQFNPSNLYRGLGTVQAAMDYLQTEDYSTKFTARYLYNNATPAGIVNLKGNVKNEEFQELKRKWKKDYGGLDNRGKIAFLKNTDVSFESLGNGLDTLPIEALVNLTDAKLQKFFQVSDQILQQFKDSNYSNSQEARRSFRRDVILPKMEDIVEVINMTLGERYGVEVILGNQVEQDMRERMEFLKTALNPQFGFMSINEARDEFNMPLSDDESANQIARNANVAPIATVDKPEEDIAERTKDIKVTLRKTIKTIEKSPEEKKLTLWKQYEFIRESWLGRFLHEVEELYKEQKEEVLEQFKKMGAKAFEDLTFDEKQELNKWVTRLLPVYIAMAQEQGNTSRTFIGLTERYTVPRELQGELRNRLVRYVTDLNASTKTSLTKLLTDGMSKGRTLDQLSDDVSKFYRTEFWKARRIARTETTKISNIAAVDSYKDSAYVTGKEWFANPGACEFCAALNGTVIEIDNTYRDLGSTVEGVKGGIYNVNYEPVGYPPLHPNCNCRALPWSKEFELTGRFLPKPELPQYPEASVISGGSRR